MIRWILVAEGNEIPLEAVTSIVEVLEPVTLELSGWGAHLTFSMVLFMIERNQGTRNLVFSSVLRHLFYYF